MRVLHTSDWHLGRSLFGRNRAHEFKAFLDWTAAVLVERSIDVLIIAGDVFDTGTPPNWAQELYYNFLRKAAEGPCQHVVIIAGNHDSPSFLNAPRALLKQLSVNVFGSPNADGDECVMVLSDRKHDNQPGLICCAVPYLRDRDVRTLEEGEALDDAGEKYLRGVQEHYSSAARRALELNAELPSRVPIVATGHLFVAGGTTTIGDGVRELTVGSLSLVPAQLFPECFDYVALGHLHAPQTIGAQTASATAQTRTSHLGRASPLIRYCGSPLHMSFGELGRRKSVTLVTFDVHPSGETNGTDGRLSSHCEEIPVPVFQRLERLRGNLSELTNSLQELMAAHEPVWVELHHTGTELVPQLREALESTVTGSSVEILCIRDDRPTPAGAIGGSGLPFLSSGSFPKLDQLSVMDVFDFKLAEQEMPDTQKAQMRSLLANVLQNLLEDDAEITTP